MKTYISSEKKPFEFNDHIVVEMLLGAPDELRTGRLVQVRKGVGAFGTDLFIVRLRDGSMRSFENVMIRKVGDKQFEEAFYVLNGRTPPVVPEQPEYPNDSTDGEYSIKQRWPETGFVIEKPKQPKSGTCMFGMRITHAQPPVA